MFRGVDTFETHFCESMTHDTCSYAKMRLHNVMKNAVQSIPFIMLSTCAMYTVLTILSVCGYGHFFRINYQSKLKRNIDIIGESPSKYKCICFETDQSDIW